MQVEVDLKCMETNFGGHAWHLWFWRFCSFSFAFKNGQISLSDHGPQLKKFMRVEVDVKCIQTNFDGCGPSGFGNFALFLLPSKMAKFHSPWGAKNRIGSKNSCK